MRARDLKKLKPGTKLLAKFSKDTLSAFPGFEPWNDRIVYLHKIVGHHSNGDFVVRSSKRVRPSTQYFGILFTNEITVVKE